jgi:mono/diheme cytochrome c family protein
MSHARGWLTGFLLLGLLFLVGCSGSSNPKPSDPPPGPPQGGTPQAEADNYTGPHPAGRKVFVANNCARCHAIGGAGGPGGAGGAGPGGPGGPGRGMKGPDLSKVGQAPAHTIDWFMEQVRNPQAHKQNSRMPKFEGKINDQDLRALAEYLASLK